MQMLHLLMDYGNVFVTKIAMEMVETVNHIQFAHQVLSSISQ